MQKNHGQNAVRRYLLKQLSGAEQEAFELRLISDDALSEELEVVEDELIDEYLANELSKDERVAFEGIFLAHPERKRKLQEGQVLKRYVDTLPQQEQHGQRKFRFLPDWISQPYSYVFGGGGELVLSPIGAMAALLVVALVGFVTWRAFIYQSDLDKGLLALNEAYRQQRPIEARVSNLDYAPFIATRSNETPPVNAFERDRADRFLSDAFKEDADAETYHAQGKSYLLKRDIDKAIEYLEQARKIDPNNAQIYADLGAAYLEKANQELDIAKPDGSDHRDGKVLEHLGRSLESLKRALEINPNLLEALFNRALVNEKQGLYNQAEADWRAYLEKDSSSQWAVEAQDHLRLLENKKAVRLKNADNSLAPFLRAYQAHADEAAWDLYKSSHTPAGNKITRALVNNFLAEDASSDTSENLQALNYIGQLELRKAEDVFTSDLAKFYSSASPETKAVMVQARRQIEEGFKLFSESKFDAAKPFFLNARDSFEKTGNLPELLVADTSIAHGAALQPDLLTATEVLERIIPTCKSKHYKWWHAQNLARQAHVNTNRNKYSEAIGDSNQSLQLFRKVEDMNSVSGVFLQLGGLYLFLNDTETSFSYLKRALATAEAQRAPTYIWSIHIATSLTLTALKLHRAALDYQNEALQLALTSSSRPPLLISRSYQYVGRTYGLLRQFDLAQQNVRLAYEQGQLLATERNGRSMMAHASLALGDIYRASGDPNSALTAYDESLRLYDEVEFPHYDYVAHKGKFLSYLALNNDAMAEHELQIVLGLFNEYREKIREERQKNLFFDREQDIYDLAIDFTYFRRSDQHRAFYYSEINRARNLRELMQHGAEVIESDSGINVRTSTSAASQIVPLTLTEIQQQLPERVQVVHYAVLEKKLLIFHLTRSRSGIFSKSVEVESAKLTEAVETTLRQIEKRDEQGSAASLKSLHNLIVEPISEQLDPNLVLCFIPDKALHYVPFGALISDRSGRYLVEDYRLMTSPSATVLIDSTKQANARTSVKDERLLAVGNPAFDRAANPNLANLPGAGREVDEIALNYSSPPPRVLTARQATRSSIVDEIFRADVAHFAAHYEVDSRSTLSSKLLLASDSREPAHHQRPGLSSADIYRMNLAHTRLVILSGCKTGIEQQFGGEGAVGFARSFLVAGVPVVVASLWPVDSDATSELMIAFHRFRRIKHRPTAEALMLAQREIMARANYRHPYFWAGFTATGGYSDF